MRILLSAKIKKRDRRRKMKKLVLVTVFIVLGIVVFAGGAGEGNMVVESFSFSGIDKLTIEGAFFEVDISGSSTAAIEAEFTFPARLRDRGVNVLHETKGSELRVWVEKKAISIMAPPRRGPRMRFTVPVATLVNVKNSSGSVAVKGLEADGLNLEVSSGSLQIDNCRSNLSATSSSGKIKVEACTGDKTLRASSGSITVLDSSGDIEAESSSGRQSYEKIEGSIATQSSSGGIAIRDTAGRLDLKSNSGRLSGTGVTITGDSSFETSSGSIEFDFTNSGSDFTFELRSSSGTISAGGTRAKGTVVTGSGKILIKGKSSSGKQSYK
jgi:hypothetical protein